MSGDGLVDILVEWSPGMPGEGPVMKSRGCKVTTPEECPAVEGPFIGILEENGPDMMSREESGAAPGEDTNNMSEEVP